MTDAPENHAAPAGARNTHFDFQAKVFQAPGACFMIKGRDKQPMFMVEMGGGQGIVSLSDLRKAFSIEAGSHDDKLIERAAAGLHYVPDIKPGDEIPNELLDGSASWTVARRHKQIAREKIQVQLLSWMSGTPVSYATQEDLKRILESDENKKGLKDAFARAAVALGHQASETDKVLDRIETMARELCYIEALRERAQEVVKIQANLETLTKVYNTDLRASADITRMKILIVKGIDELRDVLDNIDAEVADVMSALKSIDNIIKSVRKARDELHHILMEWDPTLAKWQNLNMVKSQEIDKAMASTYQFLAGRFSTGQSLMKRQQDGAKQRLKPAGEPPDWFKEPPKDGAKQRLKRPGEPPDWFKEPPKESPKESKD